jgi:putative endonuclease
MNTRSVGKFGEQIAENFLKKNGINIIKKNYFSKFGEIDLIGIEKKTIIFIEVKYRKNNNFGFPVDSINDKKIDKINKTAEMFLYENENDYNDFECRFDIISIISNNNDDYDIEWLKNQYFY